MTTLREAAQQALEAWDQPHGINYVDFRPYMDALKAALAEPVKDPRICTCHPDDNPPKPCPRKYALGECREAALAEPVQEPVAWMDIDENGNRLTVRQWSDGNREEVPLYIAPPQRKPLTEEQVERAYQKIWRDSPDDFGRTASEWIEAGIRYAERVHGIGEQK